MRLNFGVIWLVATALFLSACSTKNTTEPEQPTPTGSADKKANEKLTLNWYIIAPSNASIQSADKDFVKKAIDQKFNVDLKIEHLGPGADHTNKLNLKLGSGDVPDMFMVEGTAANKYIMDGLARDLTNWVNPQKMPNYFKYITEQELKRFQVQDVFKRAPLPFSKTYYFSYYVRKDWLDKLGMKIPQSYNEMIEVMKAFTFNDPDGNGKNDTYGYTTAGGGTSIPTDFPEFYKNGLLSNFMLEGDMFVDSYSDIRMQGVFDDLRTTLKAGIIDPDWFLQKSPEQVNKAVQGKAGIVYMYDFAGNAAFDKDPNSIQLKTKEITKNDKVDWQPFHPWANVGVYAQAVPGNPFLFSVKTPEAKVDRSIQIMDWLASEEGFLLTHYGQAGVHYTKEGSKLKINPETFKRDVTDQGSFLDVYGFFTPNTPSQYGLERINPNETDRDRSILKVLQAYKYIPSAGTSLVPPTGMDIAAFRTEMRSLHSKIMFDEKDASNWPQYRATLMSKYRGKELFESYAEQISKAYGKKFTFKAAN